MTDPIMLQRTRELLDCLSDLQTQVEKKAVEDSKFWAEIVTELDPVIVEMNEQMGDKLNRPMLKRMLEIRNKIANHHRQDIHK